MTPLERCLVSAKNAGVPRDVAGKFLSIGYVPYPWQWKFHAAARFADNDGGPTQIGARGPGKSHCVMSQVVLDDCLRADNLKVLFLRQTSKAASESFDDLVSKAIKGKIKFEKTRDTIRTPNGSKVILGGFKDARDIDKYVGIEYDLIVIEELNQITEEKYLMLRGSLRTSKDNWRPRIYASFNPGNVGHQLVKSTFVDPYKMRQETDTRFIPSNYRDNPGLNKEYIQYLEGLQGQLGKAWREGDFDFVAGQAFNELKESIHIIDPIELPQGTEFFAGYDPGYYHPFSIILFAVVPDGTTYVVARVTGREMSSREQAQKLFELKQNFNIKTLEIHIGHDASATGRGGGKSLLEELNEEGIHAGNGFLVIKAKTDRKNGVQTIHRYIDPRNYKDGNPRLYFFRNCVPVYDLLTQMQVRASDPFDVEKVDANDMGVGGDDDFDAFRYGLMSRVKAIKKDENRYNSFSGQSLIHEIDSKDDLW